VWNSSDFSSVSDNTINVTISKIRKKLWKRFKLKTKVNEGYILEA
jgi:DNA-binding response OmpR family regulator